MTGGASGDRSVTQLFDDLDRLAFRLQRVGRERFPETAQPTFTLGDLEEKLLPFREARRELAVSDAAGYDRAMLRLVAGERGYLAADPRLQAACHQTLASPSPTLALIRAWSATPLQLVSSPMTPAFIPEPSPTGGRDADPAEAATCRFCAGVLPRRPVTFCPHCGVDLTRQQCPACSTELEVGWKFCVTCGRAADSGIGR